jgi:hypothetical protein
MAPAHRIPARADSRLALESATWQSLVGQPLGHRQAGAVLARRRFGVLRAARRPVTAQAAPAETEEDGRCQRRQHDRDQQDRAQPGAGRVCRPCAAGRPSVPPWPRQPLPPASQRQQRRVECLQPGPVLVPGQAGEYREHRRQVGLAGVQRMCHSAENPLLAGGQVHQPAPIRCPASGCWLTSHAIGIAIACSFRRRARGPRLRRQPRRAGFAPPLLVLRPDRCRRRTAAALFPSLVGVCGGRGLTPSRRLGESLAWAGRLAPLTRLAGRCVRAGSRSSR